jgi:hypothetical protein
MRGSPGRARVVAGRRTYDLYLAVIRDFLARRLND